MLNQLQSEMMEARATVEQLCAEWNWTLSDKETTIVNNITINKGKVVEITKEDNSTIEMLRETIRQMNQNMNDMQKQHEEEIKELKEKLDFKELLLSEFRDNMDEKIETIHKLENEIEGMRFGYENKIAKLKEEANKPRIKIEVVDDPDFNDEPEEKPVVKETKEENKPAPKQTMRHKNVDMVLYDVHKTHDGAVRGYTKTYEFAWNGKSNVPAYKTKAMKKWHPMIGDMYAEALYIKEQVRDMFKNTKEDSVDEQEIVVPVQKPKTTTHVSNGATIVLPVVEAPEDEDVLGNTDDIDF